MLLTNKLSNIARSQMRSGARKGKRSALVDHQTKNKEHKALVGDMETGLKRVMLVAGVAQRLLGKVAVVTGNLTQKESKSLSRSAATGLVKGRSAAHSGCCAWLTWAKETALDALCSSGSARSIHWPVSPARLLLGRMLLLLRNRCNTKAILHAVWETRRPQC